MKLTLKRNFAIERGHSERAYTMLEQALVLPAVLLVVFAAVDVNNLLQAYGAIREGVKESLRCAYPVEGQCVEVNFNPPTKLYTWYQNETGPDHVYVRQYNYSAEFSWLKQPVNTYDAITATVLSQLSYSALNYNYEIQEQEFSMTADVPVITEMINTPHIWADSNTGVSTAISVTNPKFKKNAAASGGPNYPGSAMQSFGIGGGALTRGESLTREFNVKLPNLSNEDGMAVGCFTNGIFEKCGYHEDFSDENEVKHTIPGNADMFASSLFSIHVKGSQKSNGEQCKISLSLANKPGSPAGFHSPRGIGGKAYTGEGSGNLVPRGIQSENHGQNDVMQGYEEYYIHSLLLALASSQFASESNPILLKISMPAEDLVNGPSCEWTGASFDIYSPVYTVKTKTIPCANKVKLSTLLSGQEYDCKLAGPNGQVVATVDSSKAVINWASQAPVAGTVNYSTHVNSDNFTAQLSTLGIPPSAVTVVNSSSSVNSYTQSCPNIAATMAGASTANYGVAGDPNGAAKNQALAICPPPAGYEIVATNFSESQQPLPTEHQGEPWHQVSCAESGPIATGARLLYQKGLNFGSPNEALTTWVDYHTGELDPAELVNPGSPNSSEQFNCGAFPVHNLLVDAASDQPNPPANFAIAPPESLLAGNQLDLGDCAQVQVESAALVAAASHGATGNSFVKVGSVYMGEMQYSGGDANCSWENQAVTPPDSCIPYRTSPGVICSQQVVAEELPEGDVPPACQNGSASCQAIFTGFDGVVESGITENLVAASDYGAKVVQVAYPQAAKDCEGTNCYKIELRESEDGARLVAESSIKVPVNLLFGSDVTISYSDQESRELNYVR